MWKIVVAFAAGVAVGVAAGIMTRPKDDEAFEERVAEEVRAFKTRYRELHQETAPAPTAGEPQREEVKDVVENDDEAEARKSYDTTAASPDVTVSPVGRGVFGISEEEFINNPQPETETLLYYTLDKTIATVSEDLVPEADSLLGTGYKSLGADEYLYVRNLDVGVDYEVQAVPYSYKEYVLGE